MRRHQVLQLVRGWDHEAGKDAVYGGDGDHGWGILPGHVVRGNLIRQ